MKQQILTCGFLDIQYLGSKSTFKPDTTLPMCFRRTFAAVLSLEKKHVGGKSAGELN